MPAPQKNMMLQLAKMNFIALGRKMPVDWKQPGDQYGDAFKPNERSFAPNPPTNLFIQSTLNKYHVDSAKDVGQKLEAYMNGICGAICSGIDNWMKMATITGVMVNGPTGTMIPGNVVGPPLGPLILATAPMKTPQEMKYSNAIANSFNTLWQAWHMGLSGTLMYPTHAAFPGPMAPPTPNVPIPLIACSSPGESGLSAGTLKNTMTANLGDPQALHANDLFDALSKAFNTVFQMFKATTMVQNVLGMGPIPTFAPPFVPVGPVIAGVANGPPGCIM